MPAKKHKLNKITSFHIVNGFVLTLLCFVMIYPIWWVVTTSLADPVWLSSNVVTILPGAFSTDAYRYILSNTQIWTSYGNSVFYAAVTWALTLVVECLVAYPLSLKTFKPRRFLNAFILIPMFFSGGLIPEYMLITNLLHLQNTVFALALPTAFSTLYIILLRTNFASIPQELREAAVVDGAGDMRIFLQIVLPLSKVILSIISLYVLVDSWNNYVSPMLYISDVTKKPLILYLQDLLVTRATDTMEMTISQGWGVYQAIASKGGALGLRTAIKMGTIVVSVLPVMAVYPFIQRYFISGVMSGAVKG